MPYRYYLGIYNRQLWQNKGVDPPNPQIPPNPPFQGGNRDPRWLFGIWHFCLIKTYLSWFCPEGLIPSRLTSET
jgi:hypothetical protein